LPIRENLDCFGLFSVYQHNLADLYSVKIALRHGVPLAKVPGLELIGHDTNIVMASRKLAMATLVYSTIANLVITSQTSQPTDSETEYSGALYTTTEADEFYRSGNTNPCQIAWNITSSAANGPWGSYVCIDGAGAMINRALTGGVSKSSGSNIIVEFNGSVV